MPTGLSIWVFFYVAWQQLSLISGKALSTACYLSSFNVAMLWLAAKNFCVQNVCSDLPLPQYYCISLSRVFLIGATWRSAWHWSWAASLGRPLQRFFGNLWTRGMQNKKWSVTEVTVHVSEKETKWGYWVTGAQPWKWSRHCTERAGISNVHFPESLVSLIQSGKKTKQWN